MNELSRIVVNPSRLVDRRDRSGTPRKQLVVKWRVWFTDGTSRDRERSFDNTNAGKQSLNEFTTLLLRADAGDPAVVLDGRQWPVVVRAADLTLLEFIRKHWRSEWLRQSANGRKSDRFTLRMLVTSLVVNGTRPPAALDAYIAEVLLVGENEPADDDLVVVKHGGRTWAPVDLAHARRWLETHSMPLRSITRQELQQMIDDYAEGVTASTVERRWSPIKKALRSAANDGLLDPRVLAVRIDDLGDTSVRKEDVPDEDEMWQLSYALQQCADGRWRVLPLVLGGAGLRIGEALALRRRHCVDDPESGGMWIDVARAYSHPGKKYTDDGHAGSERSPKARGRRAKTPEAMSRRTYLPPLEADQLRLHLDTHVDPDPESLVFGRACGTHMNVSNLHTSYWGPAVMRAFGENASAKRYNRHAFRHLAASRWFRDGVDRAQACKWGGWKDIATMEKIYIHCMPGSERKSVAVMCNRDYQPPAR